MSGITAGVYAEREKNFARWYAFRNFPVNLDI